MAKKNISRLDFKAFKLDQVDKLNIIIFIVKPDILEDVQLKTNFLGGRVISSMPAKGVPRKPLMQMLGFLAVENFVIFVQSRAQDAIGIVNAIAEEFEFSKPGNGKAMVVDVDGYLGAKGPLCEE